MLNEGGRSLNKRDLLFIGRFIFANQSQSSLVTAYFRLPRSLLKHSQAQSRARPVLSFFPFFLFLFPFFLFLFLFHFPFVGLPAFCRCSTFFAFVFIHIPWTFWKARFLHFYLILWPSSSASTFTLHLSDPSTPVHPVHPVHPSASIVVVIVIVVVFFALQSAQTVELGHELPFNSRQVEHHEPRLTAYQANQANEIGVDLIEIVLTWVPLARDACPKHALYFFINSPVSSFFPFVFLTSFFVPFHFDFRSIRLRSRFLSL